jgi:hypothetical protein
MRKIDKDLTLATAYKKWLQELNKDGKDHPEYSSANKFYKDIVANLLWVQKGLCAYTEMFLVDHTDLDPSEWKKGRFKEFEFLGHLDHYDSTLKKKKGWEWTNFFVVHSDVNVKRKGQKPVQGVLKPDESHTITLFTTWNMTLRAIVFYQTATGILHSKQKYWQI